MLKDELINELKIKCIKMMELTFNDVNIALEAIKIIQQIKLMTIQLIIIIWKLKVNA